MLLFGMKSSALKGSLLLHPDSRNSWLMNKYGNFQTCEIWKQVYLEMCLIPWDKMFNDLHMALAIKKSGFSDVLDLFAPHNSFRVLLYSHYLWL